MKILVTGTNAPQTGSDRVPLKYATGCKALVDTLRSLGHEVDQQGVYPGERLDGYDRIVCYLAPMNALTAQWSFGVLWLLGRRPDAVVALDDWQTHQILSGAKTQNRDRGRLYREVFNRKGRDLLDDKIRRVMEGALEQLAGQPWPWTLLAPVFPHGDVSKLGLQAARYQGFDPSPYWRGHYNASFSTEARARRWVSASLLNKQPWLDRQEFGWEVLNLGNKKAGQPRVKENEVFRRYTESWGVLSAPHRHAGSGWWRARYVFAADAGCVLYGDPRETAALGSSYVINNIRDEVELAGEKRLFDMARSQRLELNQNTWTAEQLRSWAETLVKELGR